MRRATTRLTGIGAAAIALLVTLLLGHHTAATTAPSQAAPVEQTKSAAGGAAAGGQAAERPNVIIIVSDDQRDNTLKTMPTVKKELLAKGVNFTDAHSPTPTCCPARATLLTGNLAPKTGVWTNWLPNGGWQAFTRNGNEQKTLPLTLAKIGYRTGLFGKYLNEYVHAEERLAETGNKNYIPPGWDSWFAFGRPEAGVKGKDQGYYDYWIMKRYGQQKVRYLRYRDKPEDYSTDVLGQEVVNFIRKTPRSKPLFAIYSPYAPHAPYTPAPRHRKVNIKIDPSDLNMASSKQQAGKPNWVAQRKAIPIARSVNMARKQARTLLALDEQVGHITKALENTGRLKNTIIVYVSDNGMTWGEYGILGMKNFPYTTPIPMIMRWDNAPKGSALATGGTIDPRLVALPDIPQTLAEAAGLQQFTGEDGINLLNRDATRQNLLITGWRNRGGDTDLRMPSWCGTLTADAIYVRYSRGQEELYVRSRDPLMRSNRAYSMTERDTLTVMRETTKKLCNPVPPGFSWGYLPQPTPAAPIVPTP